MVFSVVVNTFAPTRKSYGRGLLLTIIIIIIIMIMIMIIIIIFIEDINFTDK